MYDTQQLKQFKITEKKLQDQHYGILNPDKPGHKISIAGYEQKFLTPLEQGGHWKGRLFSATLKKLFENDIKNKVILDLCCGRGELGIYLALKGAKVYGFDVSEQAIKIATHRASVNNVSIEFKTMDAEDLKYPDDMFDFVVGIHALHHIILYPAVPKELKRVLKPKGKIYFAENWGGNNPLLQFWRNKTTMKEHDSSNRGEVMLSPGLLKYYITDHFKKTEVYPMSFLYLLKKYVKSRFGLRILILADKILLSLLPFLKNYCGEAVIVVDN